jgi:nitroimidazol reductase NimA-like FMN-containing flavoprotein (pyridoxamine 5'-phosphate oxidase superfamily)
MTSPGVGLMADPEVISFIEENPAGVLSLVDGDKPYAVPLEHNFDGKSLYFQISKRRGRKVICIEKNPNACYVVYKSRRDKQNQALPCRSVLIEGRLTLSGTMLKMDINSISNWKCPPAMFASCRVD